MAFLRLGIGDIRSAVKICGNSRVRMIFSEIPGSASFRRKTKRKSLVPHAVYAGEQGW